MVHIVYAPDWTHSLLWVVIVAFIVVFLLAFAMGANDCANSYGPAVGSGVLTLLQAYMCATVFEILGAALLGYKVTNTIRENIVSVSVYNIHIQKQNGSYVEVPKCTSAHAELQHLCHTYTQAEFMLGALGTVIGCAFFMIGATAAKMPVSTTHSIVGATVGFSIVLKGGKGINWMTIGKIGHGGTPFLCEGTLLGWYRQCDIIGSTTDIDLCMPAAQYTDKLEQDLIHSAEYSLIWILGLRSESLEVSVRINRVKIDLFLVYNDTSGSYVAGMHVPKRQQLRWYYPSSFTDICAAELRGIRVMVPCDTESIVIADYGRNWFTPIDEESWDWLSGPKNLRKGRVYSDAEWSEVFRPFRYKG